MEFYSVGDLYPIFEEMHEKVDFSTDNFLKQNEIARTIWLVMRIDGEIKNGGVAQLFWNLRPHFDYTLFELVLTNIGSLEGSQLLQNFREYLEASEKRKERFFKDYFDKGMTQALSRLHNKLTDAYYNLTTSVESLLMNYVEKKWADTDFQQAIAHLKFTSQVKDEKELIFDLNQAIQSGNLSLTQKLVKKIENLNQASQYDFVPLLEIGSDPSLSNKKKIALATVLLENGADIHFTDKYGETVLHQAAQRENNGVFIQFLVDQGANVNHLDNHHRTPIYNASTKPNNTEVLLKNKASLTIFDKSRFTPLTNALREYSKWNGNPHANEYQPPCKKVILLLLDHGAIFHSEPIASNSLTDLGFATANPPILKSLLNNPGVNKAGAFDPAFGEWSAIFEASFQGHKESLKLLLKAGVQVSPVLRQAHYQNKVFAGATPLAVAKNKTIQQLLIDHNAVDFSTRLYSVFLETRGQESSVIAIIQRVRQLDEANARTFWEQTKKQIDVSYEEDDEGNFINYKTLLLQTFETEKEAQALVEELAHYGSIGSII